MKYNFDKVVDRSGTNALKYERRGVVFGREDVIPLWVADMDFPTAQPVIDAVTKRAQDGIWGYSDRPDSYFQAICDWQERRKGWKVDPACCSFALGVMQGIAAIIQYSTQPGDKILIFTPSYDCFYGVIRDNNRVVVESFLVEQPDGSWTIDFEDFEKKLDEVKMFMLCSPHNPLGIVWKREELEKMVSLCRQKGVIHAPAAEDRNVHGFFCLGGQADDAALEGGDGCLGQGFAGLALLGHGETLQRRGRSTGGAGGIHQDGRDGAAVKGTAVQGTQQNQRRSDVHLVGKGDQNGNTHGRGKAGQCAKDDAGHGSDERDDHIHRRQRRRQALKIQAHSSTSLQEQRGQRNAQENGKHQIDHCRNAHR